MGACHSGGFLAARGEDNPSYKPWTKVHHDVSEGCCRWMAKVQNSKLSELPFLPCAHNAACSSHNTGWSPVWYWAWTQTMSFQDQLHWGVRVFDVRLCDDNTNDFGQIYCAHTLVTNITLEMLIAIFADFLKKNPTEAVFLWIRKDFRRYLLDRQAVAEAISRSDCQLAANDKKLLDTTVADVAGKLVLLCSEDMFEYCEIHKIECPDKDTLKNMSFPRRHSIPPYWPDTILKTDVCDIWRLTSMFEAKEKLSSYLCEPHKSKPDHFVGISIDGTYNPPPPYFTSPKINEWFLANLKNDKFKASNSYLGFCELDMLTPEILSWLFIFYYGSDKLDRQGISALTMHSTSAGGDNNSTLPNSSQDSVVSMVAPQGSQADTEDDTPKNAI